MQRGHLNGSYIMPECCEVGYSATATAQGQNFKGSGKVLEVEGSKCTMKFDKRNPIPILSQICFLLPFIAFRVRIVHQRPVCI